MKLIKSFQTFRQDEITSQEATLAERFNQSMKDGFFYVKIPDASKPLIASAETMHRKFHDQMDLLKAQDFPGFTGYHDREGLQVESFYAERTHWESLTTNGVLTEDYANLASQMNTLGVQIVRRTLSQLGIPEEKWDEVTGGLSEDKATHHLSSHHYHPEIVQEGLREHTDFGYLTVLYNDKEGLEGEVDGEWVEVPPREGHFIVNFGRSFDHVTGESGRINPINHRVKRVVEERFSFGMFLDGKGERPMFKYNFETGGTSEIFESHGAFLQHCFKMYYQK